MKAVMWQKLDKVYLDKLSLGVPFGKGPTLKLGQSNLHKHLAPLGKIGSPFVITDSVSLDQALDMYKTFPDQQDGCIKVVLKLSL